MKTLKDPEYVNWAKKAGVDPAPLNSEDTTKMLFNIFKTLEPYKGEILKFTKK